MSGGGGEGSGAVRGIICELGASSVSSGYNLRIQGTICGLGV